MAAKALIIALGAAVLQAAAAHAAIVSVSTASQLVNAVNSAAPGDVITLAPGTYDLGQNILCDNAGTAAQPIVVRAAALGQAFIRFNAVEGFEVSAPHWNFENLDIQGVCALDSDCEHAFHIVGQADFTRIRNCRAARLQRHDQRQRRRQPLRLPGRRRHRRQRVFQRRDPQHLEPGDPH